MNNKVILAGEVLKVPELYVKLKSGNCLFKFYLKIERQSGNVDILPCVVKEKYVKYFETGKMVKIVGRLMSNNVYVDGKRKLDIYAFVDYADMFIGYENRVEIAGFIGKKKSVRFTPFGKKIVDFTMAHNLENGVSAYIPCIAWFAKADFIEDAKVGDFILSNGCFRSREYTKNDETKTAYEYSICNLSYLEKGDGQNECED